MFGIKNKDIFYKEYYSEIAKYNNLVKQTIQNNKFLSFKNYEFETKDLMRYEYNVVIDEKLTTYWDEYSLIDYEYNDRKSYLFISDDGYFTYVDDVDINGEYNDVLKYFSYMYIEDKSKNNLTLEDVDIHFMIGGFLINEGFSSTFIESDSKCLLNFKYYINLPLSSDLFVASFDGNANWSRIYGIVSSSGTIILPFRYSNITLLSSKRREIEDESPLYLRSDFEIFNEISFTFLLRDSEYGTWQIINSDLQILAEDLSDLEFINSSNRIVAMKYINSKYYVCLLDKNGFLLNMIQGADFKIFNEFIVIKNSDVYIFVNSISGSIILYTNFYKIEGYFEQTYFEDTDIVIKYFIIRIDGKLGLYDYNFREILSPVYEEITRINTSSNKIEFKIVKNNRVETFYG